MGVVQVKLFEATDEYPKIVCFEDECVAEKLLDMNTENIEYVRNEVVFISNGVAAYSTGIVTEFLFPGTFFKHDYPKKIAMEEPMGEAFDLYKTLTVGVKSKVSVFGKENIVLENRPSVPENAFLIQIRYETPFWIQLCKEGFIITSGVLWGKCEMGEVVSKEYALEKLSDDKWVALLPDVPPQHVDVPDFEHFAGGMYLIDTQKKIMKKIMQNQVIKGNNYVFHNGFHRIWKTSDNYVDNYGTKIPIDWVEGFVKLEHDDKSFYAPLVSATIIPPRRINLGKVLGVSK